jgi:hypothetical protein
MSLTLSSLVREDPSFTISRLLEPNSGSKSGFDPQGGDISVLATRIFPKLSWRVWAIAARADTWVISQEI